MSRLIYRIEAVLQNILRYKSVTRHLFYITSKAANCCFLWFITVLSTIQRFLPLMSVGAFVLPTPQMGLLSRGLLSGGIMPGGLMSVAKQFFFFSDNTHFSVLSNVVHGRCAWSVGTSQQNPSFSSWWKRADKNRALNWRLSRQAARQLRLECLDGREHNSISWQLVPNPDSCREEAVIEGVDTPSWNTRLQLLCALIFWVLGVRYNGAGIAISPLTILYIVMALAWFLHTSNVFRVTRNESSNLCWGFLLIYSWLLIGITIVNKESFKNSWIGIAIRQGCKRDLGVQDRDETETFDF